MGEEDKTVLTQQTNTDGEDGKDKGTSTEDQDGKTSTDDGNDPNAVKKSDVDPDGKKPEVKAGAPEEYVDFTVPEGTEIDKDMIEAFKPVAKELNLTQEQAQKLVDLQVKNREAETEAQREAFKQVRAEWVKEAREDPEIGGAKFEENVGVAVKTLRFFGSDKLIALLETSGLGDHPEVIRVFHSIGSKFGEDRMVVDGEEGTKKPKPFYEKSNHVI